MTRLARDGTAEPVPRDQFLRHERGQGNINFLVQLTTSRIGNLTAPIMRYFLLFGSTSNLCPLEPCYDFVSNILVSVELITV